MYIFVTRKDPATILVVGYDPEFDSELEFCAVFKALHDDQDVQLIHRHKRSHHDPEMCETLDRMTKEELALFDHSMTKFYKQARDFFGFKFVDDSLPVEQKELPLDDNPRPKRAEQSSHDDNPRSKRAEQSSHDDNPRSKRAEQSSHDDNPQK